MPEREGRPFSLEKYWVIGEGLLGLRGLFDRLLLTPDSLRRKLEGLGISGEVLEIDKIEDTLSFLNGEFPTVFCDVDGVLVGSKVPPLVDNLAALAEIVRGFGVKNLIITTSRLPIRLPMNNDSVVARFFDRGAFIFSFPFMTDRFLRIIEFKIYSHLTGVEAPSDASLALPSEVIQSMADINLNLDFMLGLRKINGADNFCEIVKEHLNKGRVLIIGDSLVDRARILRLARSLGSLDGIVYCDTGGLII